MRLNTFILQKFFFCKDYSEMLYVWCYSYLKCKYSISLVNSEITSILQVSYHSHLFILGKWYLFDFYFMVCLCLWPVLCTVSKSNSWNKICPNHFQCPVVTSWPRIIKTLKESLLGNYCTVYKFRQPN